MLKNLQEGFTVDSSKKNKGKAIEDMINRQLNAYVKKYGKEPGPDEPVFFDLDGHLPASYSKETLRKRLLEYALNSGADPARVLLHFGIHGTEGKA